MALIGLVFCIFQENAAKNSLGVLVQYISYQTTVFTFNKKRVSFDFHFYEEKNESSSDKC